MGTKFVVFAPKFCATPTIYLPGVWGDNEVCGLTIDIYTITLEHDKET